MKNGFYRKGMLGIEIYDNKIYFMSATKSSNDSGYYGDITEHAKVRIRLDSAEELTDDEFNEILSELDEKSKKLIHYQTGRDHHFDSEKILGYYYDDYFRIEFIDDNKCMYSDVNISAPSKKLSELIKIMFKSDIESKFISCREFIKNEINKKINESRELYGIDLPEYKF